MLPGPVEPHGPGQLDVAAEVFIARRSEQPAGEVSPVEDEPRNVWLSVQQESSVAGLDGPEAEVALDLVEFPI